jgi:hypothetical protein
MDRNKQATGSNTQRHRNLSRRDFLGATAVVGAGLAASWAASSDPTKEISTERRIGCGTKRLHRRIATKRLSK